MIKLPLARDLGSTPYEVTVYAYSSEHEIKTSTFICRGPNVEVNLKTIQNMCKEPDPYINWQCVSLLYNTTVVSSGCRASNLLMISLAEKLLKV
jgi:hypothetical protein